VVRLENHVADRSIRLALEFINTHGLSFMALALHGPLVLNYLLIRAVFRCLHVDGSLFCFLVRSYHLVDDIRGEIGHPLLDVSSG
jgi:hypothetical protein